MVKKITGEEFMRETTGTVLVDFYADWCGPCRMVSPIVEELANDNADMGFKKVNVDEEPDLAMRYNVRSIPTLILFKDGKEVDRVIGFAPKQRLQTWLDSHK
ncbi:MAG: thioredoxin [Acholeplasmataceae bacterium]|jgi:thioredoxin 1|nr:thioredoxin [Acholeplasmataceae bacterium]